MRTSTIIAALTGLASLASANPVAKRAAITDVTILQYANVLEDLEAYYYKTYLGQFDQAAFAAAGYPDWVRNRVAQIASHEADHSALLRAALGASAPPTCHYAFPGVTDVDSFLATAAVIESVGVSAYLGAAPSITTPAYVAVAGSILTVESRHQGWLNSAVIKESAWSGPYDTALGFSEVFTIAASFITGCDSALNLPFKAFPSLTVDLATGSLTYAGAAAGDYAIVRSGLDVKAFEIVNSKASLPALQGFAYITVATTNNLTMVDDSTIKAGPFIVDVPFTSKVANPTASF